MSAADVAKIVEGRRRIAHSFRSIAVNQSFDEVVPPGIIRKCRFGHAYKKDLRRLMIIPVTSRGINHFNDRRSLQRCGAASFIRAACG
jgi:hypothetical protein